MFPLMSDYGTYRTSSFIEEFPTADDFLDFYKNNGGFPTTISDDGAKTLYYLLYARYGEDHIAMSSYNRFKYAVMAIIFQYGPTWEKRLEIQDNLRKLSIDDLQTGTLSVTNLAKNPGNKLATDDELIKNVNDQSRTKYKKSKLDAYGQLYALLETDVTEEFLGKFKKLFNKFASPTDLLEYYTKENL